MWCSSASRIQTHNERYSLYHSSHCHTPEITFVITLEHYSNTGTSCLKQSFASAKLEFDDSMYVESCDDVLNHVREAGWILEDVRLMFEFRVSYCRTYSLDTRRTPTQLTLSLEHTRYNTVKRRFFRLMRNGVNASVVVIILILL